MGCQSSKPTPRPLPDQRGAEEPLERKPPKAPQSASAKGKIQAAESRPHSKDSHASHGPPAETELDDKGRGAGERRTTLILWNPDSKDAQETTTVDGKKHEAKTRSRHKSEAHSATSSSVSCLGDTPRGNQQKDADGHPAQSRETRTQVSANPGIKTNDIPETTPEDMQRGSCDDEERSGLPHEHVQQYTVSIGSS